MNGHTQARMSLTPQVQVTMGVDEADGLWRWLAELAQAGAVAMPPVVLGLLNVLTDVSAQRDLDEAAFLAATSDEGDRR